MTNLTYYRICGHLLILYFLTVPMADVPGLIEKHMETNNDVKVLASMKTRFATLWNVVCQLVYASTALMIDLSSVFQKDWKIPAGIKKYRYIFFAGIIFPIVCGSQMFWLVFFYDRELVFPKALEVAITFPKSFITHAGVLMYALWELIFLPEEEPRRNQASWIHVHVFNIAYLLATLYTRYVDFGIWPYQVLTATAGTLVFPLLFFSLWILSTLGYYLQWPLKRMVWQWRESDRSSLAESNKVK